MRVFMAALLSALAGAAPVLAQAPPVVDASTCQTLTRHRPSADTEYRPGVDVKGRPVAPADLPGSASIGAIDRFDIPVTLDLARRLGLGVPTGGLRGNTQIGWLTLDANRLYFNGQPIGDAAQAELYAYCRTR